MVIKQQSKHVQCNKLYWFNKQTSQNKHKQSQQSLLLYDAQVHYLYTTSTTFISLIYKVSSVYCNLICFTMKISVYLCVFVSLQTRENCAFYQIFGMMFSKFRNVCVRYDPGGHLLLLGRPSFILCVDY